MDGINITKMSDVYDISLTKICSTCKETFTLEFFNKDKHAKYGRQCQCRQCDKNYKNINKEKIKIYNKSWRNRNQEKHRMDVRFINYKKQGLNINREEYTFLYNKQEGKCAICEKSNHIEGKNLCLDHCHNTLKVRGFLCHDCNIAIGKFKDDINLLHKAIIYISKNK